MIAAPFCFFLFLLLFLWMKNHRVDTPFIIICIYGVSAFLSIIIDILECRPPQTLLYDITPHATFVYCFLFAICIVPLINYSDEKVFYINPVPNEKILKNMSVVCFCFFCFFCVMAMNLFIGVLTGDMSELRKLAYAGQLEGWTAKIPNAFRPIVSLFSAISINSWILLFLSFYSLVVQKLQARYVVFYFISSLYAPILSILIADRSVTTYWIISFVILFFYFRPFMSVKQKKIFKWIGALTTISCFTYLVAMTNSRFGNSNYGNVSGSSGGALTYLGQSFIHFAFFFDTLDLPEKRVDCFFPFISSIFSNSKESIVSVQNYLSGITKLHIGVFYSFYGHVLVIAGKVAMFLYCIGYSLLSFLFLRKDRICQNSLSILQVYYFLFFSSMLFLGPFTNYYTEAGRNFSILFWWFVLYLAQREKI